jgi:type IV secretion system protein TrbL
MFTFRVGSCGMLLALMLCLLPVAAHAQNAPQDGQLVPGVINLFTSLNLNLDVLRSAAENLFWGLAIIGLFWSMVVLLFRRADISEFFFEMVSFTLFTGLFYWLLTHASDSSGLISIITNSFKQLGGDLTGQGQSGTDLALSGNNIVNMGLSIFNTAVNQTDGMAPGEQMMLFTVALLVLGTLAMIGTQVVLVLIMAWMLAYGGIFLLGFGGSRWTSLVAISYYKHVIAVGIALLGLMVIVAFGEGALFTSTTQLIGGAAIDMYTLAQMLVLSLIMMVLAIKVPSLLYRMVTGSQLGLLAGTATMTGHAISAGSGAIYNSVYNSATQAFSDYRAHYHSISHDRNELRTPIDGASAVVRASAVEAIRQAAGGVGVSDAVYQSMNMPQYNATLGRVSPEAVSAADGQSGSVFTHAGGTSQSGSHASSPSAQASSASQKMNSQGGGDNGPATSNTGVLYPAGLASAGTASSGAGMQERTSRPPMQGGASSATSVSQTQSAMSKVSSAVAADMTDVRQHGGMAGVGGAGATTSAARATLGGGFQPNMPASQSSSSQAAQGSPRTSLDGMSNQNAGVAVAAAGSAQSAWAQSNMPTSAGSSGKPDQSSARASMDGASSQKAGATVAAAGAVQAGIQPNMPVSADTFPKPGGGFQPNTTASSASGKSDQGLPRTSPDASPQKASTTVAGAGAPQAGAQPNMPVSTEASQKSGGGFQPNMPASSTSGKSDQGLPRTSSEGATQKASTTVAGAGAPQAGAQPNMPVSTEASQKPGGGFQPNMPASSTSGKSDQGLPRTSPDASTQKAGTTVAGAGAAQAGAQPNMPVSAETSQKPGGGFQPNMSASSTSGKSDQGLPRTSSEGSTQNASTTGASAGAAQGGTAQSNMPVSKASSQMPSSGFQPNLPASQASSGKSSQGTPRMSPDAATHKSSTTTTVAGTIQSGGVSSNMPVTMTSSQRPNPDLPRSAPDTSTQKAVSRNRTPVQDDQPSQVVSSRPTQSKFKRRAVRNKIALKREVGKTSSPADPRNPRRDDKPAKDEAKPADRGKPDDAESGASSEDEVVSFHDRQSPQADADTDGD